MRGRFRFTPSGGGPSNPWFHIGTLEVTTTMAVVLLSVVSFVIFAVEPIDKPVMWALAMEPDKFMDGQVWRAVTWPLSYPGVSLWDVLAVFFFWYFGTDLETNLLGRQRMLRFLLGCTLVLGLLLVALYQLSSFGYPLTGLNSLELMVLLAWIAEWPQRRFLFNVPAWLFGVVIVGISILQFVGYRQWWLLLDFLLGIALCALVARREGMLTAYHWIPNLRLGRQRRAPKPRRTFNPGRPTVVSGPWEPPVSRDEARMNALLEKIHASGQASLTEAERAELLELRERLRRRG